MFFLFVFCKDNVFTIDFWLCNEKLFSAVHSYLPITLSFSMVACFILLCTFISVVVCVFDLLFMFRA